MHEHSKIQRSILTQFRLGILPLNIEKGRHKNTVDPKGNIRKQKPEEWVCTLCSTGSPEDEFHFLYDCMCYSVRNTEKHCLSMPFLKPVIYLTYLKVINLYFNELC